ncbi:methionine ABC transporter ATP-binding protein [Pseudogracilibacillus auburnensis]|uniref:D-methionine transport system ATP-binding protein n=1 Tax=Pseudogracilibacillus auburnensis TaxID=1494959 RepID=A0A2V3VKM2_9BACI|nr:methionine ABC transporter ATP-binding protein [Pseudogracilibacillus auburnensis]MBO1004970.1 methionine ABC transporter ATP-binding protein [Pseudogracilibacillus auburnensis]PXW81461.1 D-methionine transport system ATP-binding protein [Pseudogracilibacillus auburnensis]
MISIQNLKKIFTLDKQPITAVDSLSLDINEGEIFGVIGYSGAGKSTFVRLLNRLEEPTDGTIFIDGKEMTKLTSRQLRLARQEIGMIFQHFNLLWSRTTEENIAFPLEIAGVPKVERKKRVQELIDLVGLTGREKAYPSQLSGGQKQRVGIARALANNPKVLLCDEATSALDPETTNSILDLLVGINEKLGLTIILITHEMHVIRKICNRVAVMEKGKIVEHGNVLDVFSNPKQPVTKKFVEQVVAEGDQDDSLEYLLTHIDPVGKVLRLQFTGTGTNQALISEVAKQFSVQVNMLQGKITQTKNGPLGTLTVQMIGEKIEIQKAESFIKEATVEVEVIRDDS